MAARRRSAWPLSLGGTIIAGSAAAAAALLGPETEVVCGQGHALNRLAQKIMQPLGAGHVDGPSATYCVVPSTAAWAMSLVALVAVLGLTLVIVRRRGRRSGTLAGYPAGVKM
jgi:hypothetical protein